MSVCVFLRGGGGDVEHVTSGGEVHRQGCMETGDHIMIAASNCQTKKNLTKSAKSDKPNKILEKSLSNEKTHCMSDKYEKNLHTDNISPLKKYGAKPIRVDYGNAGAALWSHVGSARARYDLRPLYKAPRET